MLKYQKICMCHMHARNDQLTPVTVLSQLSLPRLSNIRKPQIHCCIKHNQHIVSTSQNYAAVVVGSQVKIRGCSIGKGFSGVIKRHHFKSGRASHGNSKAHHKPGSTGMTQDPGRVFKGKRMAGQLGNKSVTITSCSVVYVSSNNAFIAIAGSIPGPKGAVVTVYNA